MKGAAAGAAGAGSAASPISGGGAGSDGTGGMPRRWLLWQEAEGLALAELLRALRNTGLELLVLPLPGDQKAIEALAQTLDEAVLRDAVMVVASTDAVTLARLCERARAPAARWPTLLRAALLACWIPEQGQLPALVAEAATQVLRAGADDLVLGAPAAAELLARAATAQQAAARRRQRALAARYDTALVAALDLLGGGDADEQVLAARDENAPLPEPPDATQVFHRLLKLAAQALGAERAALLLLESEPEGVVIVSSSRDPEQVCVPAPTHGYPVLRAIWQGRVPTALPAGEERSLLGEALNFRRTAAALVAPLVGAPLAQDIGRAPAQWVLLLLSARESPFLSAAAMEFVRSFGQLLGLGVLSRRLDEQLRDRTRRLQVRHVNEERRQKALQHYREFFESSPDGVLVLDESARVLWINRAAEQMTGYATAGLSGRPLSELTPQSGHRERVQNAVTQALLHSPVPPFDLAVTSTSRETLVLSVSTLSALAAERCVVLSFRDVTERRALEMELRKTKEFLERLIDSTVDGIIAADVQGRVVLFNQGAARITGYAPEEVIGKMPVWSLYPEDEGRRIMAQLRSEEFGGKGRLLQSRKMVLGKSGTPIPVALSASIIYEVDREVATVGVLSDLRERLRIEQRLMQTEERLAETETQALIVELAGTAAHELNQPLTSVMGYAELLRRRLPDAQSEIHEFADILVREAERMAEIVRKIGRITRYETKSYVGEARILDLDKAAQPEPPIPDLPRSGRSPSMPELIFPDLEDAPLFQATTLRPRGPTGNK